MRVAFRVDASNRIGTGHVMRCLTLAQALREKGAECVFIHRAHSGHMMDTIRKAGFDVHMLSAPEDETEDTAETDYAAWLGVSQEQDAAETQQAFEGALIDWLVVDHYALNEVWERALRNCCRSIAVIDDLADRDHDCDLLVDQNYVPDAESRYKGRIPASAQCLLGPTYALLKEEYAQARHLSRPRRGPLSRILVFYGGADIHNETGRALQVLSYPEFQNLAVDVVVGVNNPHRAAILELADQRPRTEVHGPRPHLIDLMIDADLALGGGGTTTWERCALGLPSIVTAMAENQVPFNQVLGKDGVIDYLGHWAEVNEDDLATTLRSFLEDEDALPNLAHRTWQVTDGLGRLRVAEVMLRTASAELMLRPAREEDKLLYFVWANDPDTRRHAFNPEPIAWETHDAWFDSRLQHPESNLWVMVTPGGLPVGQVRVDTHDDESVLSYGLDPAFRGRGWGTRLLELAMAEWRSRDCPPPLVGDVRSENAASRRIFLKLGFEEVETGDPDHLRYRWSPSPSGDRWRE